MACQMEMVLGVLISNGYNLDYKKGNFKKYVGNGDLFVKLVINLEEVHLMDAMQINRYLQQKEEEMLQIIKTYK